MFSFNAPFGACDVCNGLGESKEVDPELVVPNKDLSIKQGAVAHGVQQVLMMTLITVK